MGEQEDLGEDIEDESTAVNIQQVSRNGDISPRSLDTKKSTGKHTRKQKEKSVPVRLLNLHRKYNFYLIGLIEPWQDINKLEEYRRKLGIHDAYANINGKIWAFIDEDIDVEIITDMEQQMTLTSFHKNLGKELIVTLVYAKCDAVERIELWDSMYYLASDMESPWLVGGDFNIILSEEEKYGGLPIYLREVANFAHCIDTCALYDLGCKESLYTWWNGRSDMDCIFKRLDIYLANQQFQDMFPALEVEYLIKYGSDHASLVLYCNADIVQVKKPFKLLNFWKKRDTFLRVVKGHWNTDSMGNPFIVFQNKIKDAKKVLSAWSKETFGDILNRL
ncbi:uncharacterized protein LOC142166443 [Nicotiana tabacum]|uniref:Uncharacterized protein LOC142166443 n=1 Tax=Nicotiana tabacum TaxID=4097 RepID=A0AC58SA31_TOBAC